MNHCRRVSVQSAFFFCSMLRKPQLISIAAALHKSRATFCEQQKLFCRFTKEHSSSVPPPVPPQIPQALFNTNKLPCKSKCQAGLGERVKFTAYDKEKKKEKNQTSPTAKIELCIQILLLEPSHLLL